MSILKNGWFCLTLLLNWAVVAVETPVFYAAGKDGIAVIRKENTNWRKTFFTPAKRPMYLAISPNGKTLAAALAAKTIRIYEINPEKELLAGRDFYSGGKTCCHVTYSGSGKTLYAANYTGGSISALDCNGMLHLINHAAQIKRKPHPHFSAETPDKRQLAVCDLGLDKIFLYQLNKEIPEKSAATVIKLPEGSGPRHLLFSPDGKFIYNVNELNSTVCVFQKFHDNWQLRQTFPATGKEKSCRNYPGAIRFSENKKFIIVSNRGADNIAVFAVKNDGLLEKCHETAVSAYPSDLLQFSQTLVIACRKGNCVEIRDFSPGTGEISECRQKIELTGAAALAK